MEWWKWIIIGYLAAVNIAAFAAMGIDKQRARRHRWRIRERTLFWLALLFGSVGAWAGMYAFRHKTRRRSFVMGIPAIFAAQAALVIFVLLKSGCVRF